MEFLLLPRYKKSPEKRHDVKGAFKCFTVSSCVAGGVGGDNAVPGGAESCGGAEEGVPGVCVAQSAGRDGVRGLPAHGLLLPPAAGARMFASPSKPVASPFDRM